MGARAANVITISSAEGAPSDEVTVSIGMENTDAISSLQVSIPLDESLTLIENSGQLGSRCGSHALNVGVKDGVLNIFVYSLSMAAITGNSGEVANFKLKLSSQPATIDLTPSKTMLTGTDGKAVSSSAQGGDVTIRCAKAQYNTLEVDFGEVPIRSTYEQTVTVQNVGNDDLTITGLLFSDVNVFSSNTSLPLTLEPGASRELNITYAPVERGTISKTLKVECNSISKLNTIALKAKPFAVNELHVQNASGISDEEVTVSMTMNNMDAISGYQVEYDLPEQFEYVDNSFTLSSRKQDHVSTASLSGRKLRIIAYSPTDKPFTGDDGEIGSFKVKLIGRYGTTLTPSKTVLSATINNKVENVVSAVYGGQVDIYSPQISCDDQLDFGAVSVTEDCEKTFTISNNGNAPLTINRVTFDNEALSIKETLPLVVPAYDNADVTVVYSSLEQKSFEAVMHIYSNDPDLRMKDVAVSGSRFAPNYVVMRAPKTYVGENAKVEVDLNVYDTVSGLQFDFVYPSQYFEVYDGNVVTTDRAQGMTISYREIDAQTVRYLCYFLNGQNIPAGNGQLMTIQLRPKNGSAPVGTYQVMMKNVKIGTSELTDKYVGSDLELTFQVKKHDSVVITAKSYTRVYGDVNPTFEFSSEGADLEGTPEITCEATATSPVGEYPIVITKGSVENEEDSYVNGVLTITKAPLEIMAKSYSIKQGEALPTFETEYTGFKNNETSAVLSKQPMLTCSATSASTPGTYDIIVSGAEAGNYEISYTKGTLTITDADPVKVTAKSYTRKYGDANPAFEYDVTGAVLEGTPEITCEATATSPVGTYPIVIKKGSVTNYNDSYINGVLTITKSPLDISVGTYTKKQGEAMPEFIVSYDGFKNNETKDVLTKLPEVNCEANESSAPGEYPVSVSGAEAQNYDIGYTNGKLIVTEAEPVTIVAMNCSRTYGDDNPTFEFQTAGAPLDGTPEITCEATPTSPVGTYDIVVKQGTVKNYNVAYVTGTLTVTKAPLNISVGTYTKKQGEAMPEFIVSYDGFKNNETKDVLTKLPEVNCEANESSAPGEYPVSVSGAEAQNYDIGYTNGKLIVTEADPVTIVAMNCSRTYGDDNPTFEFQTAGAPLDGTPEITCEATPTSPVGTYDIVVKQGTVKNYNVTYVTGTLTVTKAPLNISVGTYTKIQGEAMPEFIVSYDGFKNNETKDVLTKLPEVNCEANESSAPGEYPVSVSGAEAQNYDIGYTNGKLIVTEADPVTIVAMNCSRTYGDDNPTFEFQTAGAPLDGTPEITCEATPTSPVGTYDIVVKQGTVKNYNVTYVTGTLTVMKAPLTVKAGDYTKKQGDPMPELVPSYEGFKNNETSEVLTKQPIVSCEATETSAPGEYPITVSGAEAQNYEISYTNGRLFVTEADPVTIVAMNCSRTYGDDNPTFEFQTAGAPLDGTPEITCEATPTSPVGTYDIVVKQGTVKNYNVTYVTGTLTVMKAPLTVKAGDYTKKQGDPMPELVPSYEGFKNNETSEVLTKQPIVSCEATETSAPGEYSITVSGAEAQNYAISYVNGVLTVLQYELRMDLAEGWNWISTSAATEAITFLDPIKDKTQRLVSQTQELINDAEYGLVGGLQTMEVTAGYKLKMEEEAIANLTGNFADPSATTVQLYKGWNWIGYVPMVALPVETALENLQATAGDKLVCKDEFAEYDGNAWVPAGIMMQPGEGYMYKSAKDVAFKYSSATSAPSASRLSPSTCYQSLSQSPWQYDDHRYPDNMTIVAQLENVESQVTVGAFCGDECRGVGRWVNDKLFISVQGSAGNDEMISFRCYDSTTDDIVPIAETIVFDGDSHGSLAAPIRLNLQGIATGIDANGISGTYDVYSTSGMLVRRHVTSLRGLAPGVYLVRGRKVVVR